jgi:hypothetical protein
MNNKIIYGTVSGYGGNEDVASESKQDDTLSAINNLPQREDALSSEQILTDILVELKKINMHLSLMTDETIKNTEVG